MISGLYNKPFWEIKVEINKSKQSNDNKIRNRRIFVNLATRSGKTLKEKEDSPDQNDPAELLNAVTNRKVLKSSEIELEKINVSVQLKDDRKR